MPDLLNYESGQDRRDRRPPVARWISCWAFGIAMVLLIGAHLQSVSEDIPGFALHAAFYMMAFVGLPTAVAALLPPAEPNMLVSIIVTGANAIGALVVFHFMMAVG